MEDREILKEAILYEASIKWNVDGDDRKRAAACEELAREGKLICRGESSVRMYAGGPKIKWYTLAEVKPEP